MMSLQNVLGSRRLIMTLTVLMALMGVLSFGTMNRQEDPFFPYRGGSIQTLLPGADPERIERLVVRHLERELSTISELNFVRSVVRQSVAITTIVMEDSVYDTDGKWDEIRRAIDRAKVKFPPGTSNPVLDDRVITTSTATFALVGGDDLHAMAEKAEDLRDAILQVGNIIRVDIYGDPKEQVTIALSDETAQQYGVSSGFLAAQLKGRVQLLPGGSVIADSTRMTLRPETDFRSIDELRGTPIRLPNGDVVPLGGIAEVWLGEQQPSTERMWFDGQPTVLVDVVAEQNDLNIVAYGKRLRKRIEEVRPLMAPFEIKEMFFQPARVEGRLGDLSMNLLWAMLIILSVLVLSMGIRLGLLVAVILPLVASITIGVYALGGGVLHQMAVMGMVIALGILVDNAIVVIEEVQWRLNQGHPPAKAAVGAVTSLAKPLMAATGTTLAAFVPMAAAPGGVGDFTRALPIMIMTSLVISYLFALFVTPNLGSRYLRPSKNRDAENWASKFGRWAGRLGTQHAALVLLAGVGLIVGAMAFAAAFTQFQFFPLADRNQVVIDIDMGEGTTQAETTRVTRLLERAIRKDDDVLAVHGFIGHTGPRFYYNLLRQPSQPNRARLVAETTSLQANQELIAQVREHAKKLPEAAIVAKILSQGPPVDAPIEVRIFNADSQRLAEATEQIFEAMQAVPGTIDVAHNLGLGAPRLRLEIDDAAALQFGLTRADVAQALLGRSRGVQIGEYRAGDEPVPILVRSLAGENYDPARLETISIYNGSGQSVPLLAIAKSELSWQPGAVYTRDQQRIAKVSGELDFGYVFSGVMDGIKPALEALELPPGTRYEFGGEAEASGDANTAILQSAPMGLALLLFFLLWQFNSFRRVGIVLLTVPLAFVGVFPGLALLGIPFGFQPLLGSIALIGIVVNNAIVMLDVLDQRLADGVDFQEAIIEAVARRTQPILLTTATTIAGLLPLAVSKATLWPPMAWALISGLLSSTLLTLFVVPALCRLLLGTPRARSKPSKGKKGRNKLAKPAAGAAVLATVAALTLAPQQAWAVSEALAAMDDQQAAELPAIVSLERVMELAAKSPPVQAEWFRHMSAASVAKAERRAAYLPRLSLNATALHSENAVSLDTPFGSFQLSEHFSWNSEVRLSQPLLHLAQSRYRAPAARQQASAQAITAERRGQAAAMQAAELYLLLFKLRAQLASIDSLYQSFDARLQRVQSLAKAGRALKADALDVRLARDDVRRQQIQLQGQERVLLQQLQRLTGLPFTATTAVTKPSDETTLDGLPEWDKALANALQKRAELKALDASIKSLKLQQGGVRAEAVPTVGASISHLRSDGQAFNAERDNRAAIQLQWDAFAGGTRSARADALQAQREALYAERSDVEQLIAIELQQAYSNYSVALESKQLAEDGVVSATERLRSRNERYQHGRETIDDVLQAEASLAQQKTQQQTAAYDLILAKLQLRFASGEQIVGTALTAYGAGFQY